MIDNRLNLVKTTLEEQSKTQTVENSFNDNPQIVQVMLNESSNVVNEQQITENCNENVGCTTMDNLVSNEPQNNVEKLTEKSKNENPLHCEPTIVFGDEKRKPAFASFNRTVNIKNVQIILEKIKVKGYRKGEPIQVIKAEDALRMGIISLFDLNKLGIPLNKINDYYLILDGQHRTIAVALYNMWAKENGEDEILIPAIEVDLINGETITEYCNEINITKKEWSREDYVKGAASVHIDDPLLKRYDELIKTEENPNGFSLSTLNLIFIGGNGLTKRDLELLCSGVTKKGVGGTIDIVPDYNLELGNWFISTCLEKGFKVSEIRKRYLIEEFNRIAINKKMPEKAKSVFESITSDDISAMTTKTGRLIPENVIEHFRTIFARV
jgi:hypothetical protein